MVQRSARWTLRLLVVYVVACMALTLAALLHGGAKAIALCINIITVSYYIYTLIMLFVYQLLVVKYRCKRRPTIVHIGASTPWLNLDNARRLWEVTGRLTPAA